MFYVSFGEHVMIGSFILHIYYLIFFIHSKSPEKRHFLDVKRCKWVNMVRKIAINWLIILCNYFLITHIDLNCTWVGRQTTHEGRC